MRQTNEEHLVKHLLWIAIFLLLLPSCTFGGTPSADSTIWNGYSPGQRKLSIAGFVHCYRTASPNKNAFAQSDDTETMRMIDQAVSGGREELVGNSILQALKKAPRAKPDIHAEHWSGPYGFASGLWWRGLDDQDRQAYVQGVFWCAEIASNVAVSVPEKSVREAVKKLNDWYVISDEDWKDTRSNARVDVPVVLAMQRSDIILIKQVKTP